MSRIAAAATLIVGLTWSGLATAEPSKQASYFIDGPRNATLLAAIRAGTYSKITFNRHFSVATASCGPGCVSYWFVDRQTGGVVEVPQSGSGGDQTIWDVVTRPESDTITAVYGPADGVPTRCFARRFRLAGKSFVPLDGPSPAICPPS